MRELLVKYRGDRTQRCMAAIYKVTQQTWSNWEKGVATPSARIMKQIEIDSNCSMESLFFDHFNKNNLSDKNTA